MRFLHIFAIVLGVGGACANTINPNLEYQKPSQTQRRYLSDEDLADFDSNQRLSADDQLTKNKLNCMIKYNLQSRKELDHETSKELKIEIGKLQNLIQVLKDQQYILSILNDEVKMDPNNNINGMISHLKKIDREEETIKPKEKEEIEKLKDEIKELKTMLMKRDSDSEDVKLIKELRMQKEQIDLLKNMVEKVKSENKAVSTSKKRLASSEDDTNAVMKRILRMRTLDDDTLGISRNKTIWNGEGAPFRGDSRSPTVQNLQTGNYKSRSALDFDPFQNERSAHHHRNASNHFARKTSDDLDSLLDLLTPKHDATETIAKLLDHLGSAETKSGTSDLETLLEIQKELNKRKKNKNDLETKLKELQKKLKKKKELESKNLDDGDEIEELRKVIKKLGGSSVESKDDEIDLELKSLEKAIKSLQPKEEEDDLEEKNANVEVMLEKLQGGNRKLNRAQIRALRKRLMGMKGGHGHGHGHGGGVSGEDGEIHVPNKIYSYEEIDDGDDYAGGGGSHNDENGYGGGGHVNGGGYGGKGYGNGGHGYSGGGHVHGNGGEYGGGGHGNGGGYGEGIHENGGGYFGGAIGNGGGYGNGGLGGGNEYGGEGGHGIGGGYSGSGYGGGGNSINNGYGNGVSYGNIGYGNGGGYGIEGGNHENGGYGSAKYGNGANYGNMLGNYGSGGFGSYEGKSPGYNVGYGFGPTAGGYNKPGGYNSGSYGGTSTNSAFSSTYGGTSGGYKNVPGRTGGYPAGSNIYNGGFNGFPAGTSQTAPGFYANPPPRGYPTTYTSYSPSSPSNLGNYGSLPAGYLTTYASKNGYSPNTLPPTSTSYNPNTQNFYNANNPYAPNIPGGTNPTKDDVSLHKVFEHITSNYQKNPGPFFPAPPGGDYNKEGTQAPPIDQHQSATYSPSDPFAQQKVEDIKTQINGLQNVVDSFNKPEYMQKPEDQQTVYNLDKQIKDLRNVVNTLQQDYPVPEVKGEAGPPQSYSVSAGGGAGAGAAPPSAIPPPVYVQEKKAGYARSAKKFRATRDINFIRDSSIESPLSRKKRDTNPEEALHTLTSLFSQAFLDSSEIESKETPRASFSPPHTLQEVNQRVIELRKQLDHRLKLKNRGNDYGGGGDYGYNYDYKGGGKEIKKIEKNDFFDKFLEKIIDKVLKKIGKSIPKIIEAFFGNFQVQDYGGGDGYSENGYSLEKTFGNFGFAGIIPMIIMKFLSKIQYIVSYLQKYKFFRTFLIPAVVLLIVAGAIIFLIWWLQSGDGKEEQYNYQPVQNYQKPEYNYHQQDYYRSTNPQIPNYSNFYYQQTSHP